jgi:hypothetical protein
MSDDEFYKLWCSTPTCGNIDEDVMMFARALLATPSDKQEAVSANAADVQRDANRIAYENWEKETADGEFEITVDSRDLFDVLRACWRDGQSYGESSEQASWSMASDYASKALKEWWNTGAAPLAQSAEQDRIGQLEDQIRVLEMKVSVRDTALRIWMERAERGEV